MPRQTKNYRFKSVSKRKCARGSMRTIATKRGRALVRICCPVGKWMPRKRRCKVGTFAKEIGRRRRRRGT